MVTQPHAVHHERRHAESIPLLEPLVERRPDRMSYRASLMRAYFQTKRFEQLTQLVADTHEHFHGEGVEHPLVVRFELWLLPGGEIG